jgi:hypothetical protein
MLGALTEGREAASTKRSRRHRQERCAPGVKQQSRHLDRVGLTLLLRNATSHTDRHGLGCPSAPAMRRSGDADLTAALHLLATNSYVASTSSSLGGTARTAASGVKQPRAPGCAETSRLASKRLELCVLSAYAAR